MFVIEFFCEEKNRQKLNLYKMKPFFENISLRDMLPLFSNDGIGGFLWKDSVMKRRSEL